jgi:hypothetical protein
MEPLNSSHTLFPQLFTFTLMQVALYLERNDVIDASKVVGMK